LWDDGVGVGLRGGLTEVERVWCKGAGGTGMLVSYGHALRGLFLAYTGLRPTSDTRGCAGWAPAP